MTPEERPPPDQDQVRETLRKMEEEAERAEQPETEDLDQDPAYDPDDPELKRLKGG